MHKSIFDPAAAGYIYSASLGGESSMTVGRNHKGGVRPSSGCEKGCRLRCNECVLCAGEFDLDKLTMRQGASWSFAEAEDLSSKRNKVLCKPVVQG